MIKKYYTLVIASEADHINKSFKISRFNMYLIILFSCVVVIFSILGFRYHLNFNEHEILLSDLKQFENNIVDLVTQNSSSLSDSLILKDINNIINTKIAQVVFQSPVDGFVTQSINEIKNHYGLDIASEKGKAILAAFDGLVIYSSLNGDLGNTVIIAHPYNYFSVYGHCDSLHVKERQNIKTGEIIATVGETGKATAPHLHFEIWYNDSIIDPRKIINKYGDFDVSAE